LLAVAVVLLLLGCAPAAERKETTKQEVTIDLDLRGATRIVDSETGETVSTGDSCKAYLAATSRTEELYALASCSYIAAKISLARTDKQQALPGHPKCSIEPVPKMPAGMKNSMGSFCEENLTETVMDALDFYWDESIKKGAFN